MRVLCWFFSFHKCISYKDIQQWAMRYTSSNKVRDLFEFPVRKKENLQTVWWWRGERPQHPSGGDAASKLREAMRDTSKVKDVGIYSLIDWKWLKYQCRKNPDLFMYFYVFKPLVFLCDRFEGKPETPEGWWPETLWRRRRCMSAKSTETKTGPPFIPIAPWALRSLVFQLWSNTTRGAQR